MPQLQELSLFWNSFGPVGVAALAKGLENATGMKRLNLAWNNVGDDGAVALARSLHSMPSLVELSLAWSNIGNAGIRAIAAALQHVPELRELRVKWNDFDDIGAAALAGAVAKLEARVPTAGPGHAAVAKQQNTATAYDQDVLSCSKVQCHALVLGNANYSKGRLPDEALTGAREMAKVLEGSNVKVSALFDGSQKIMRSTVKQFAASIRPGEVSLVYFFGHGLQQEGMTYLLPSDFPSATAKASENNSVSLSWLLESLQDRHVAANFLVIDACHRHPFGGEARGLAPVGVPPGALIAFSAAPGTVVERSDDSAFLGRYARDVALLLKEPRVSLEEVLKKVRRRIAKDTNNTQVPWEESALTVDCVVERPGHGKEEL